MQHPLFCDKDYVRRMLEDKIIALVGSGPGVLSNKPDFIDSHEVVIRVNNYKLMRNTGRRTDVFYSYFGQAIKKASTSLRADGVKLCMAKCPDAQFIDSDWHKDNGLMNGVDFRPIYERRADWWFCKTYVPTIDEFMENFNLLGGHVPTTGFAALLDILQYNPAHVYMTGFDFFTTKIHNVNERWKPSRKDDPIGHVPMAERKWFYDNLDNIPVSMDRRLEETIRA
jgi:hypothetical protein